MQHMTGQLVGKSKEPRKPLEYRVSSLPCGDVYCQLHQSAKPLTAQMMQKSNNAGTS